jgi:hypothetical protein
MARNPRITAVGEIDQQSVERRDLDVLDFAEAAAEKAEPFLQREKRMLLVVVGDGDDDFIEQFSGAIDDIEVAVRDRIEAARINGAADHGDECRMTNDECRMAGGEPRIFGSLCPPVAERGLSSHNTSREND